MNIWHKALRQQWSAEDLDWAQPQRITRGNLRDQLARVLTPVLMGEQAALYSVSGLIPILGSRTEVESQFYLTTWAVDEARHTELFARFYHRLDREPLPIRRFRSGYLFQSQINSSSPEEWLAGVLVSEVLAKILLEDLKNLDLDPLLSDICAGILRDEARHLGFNQIYMEDRFRDYAIEGQEPFERALELLKSRIRRVLDHVPPMLDAVDEELLAIGLDRHRIFHDLEKGACERLEKSAQLGLKAAGLQFIPGSGQ